ncbi:DUF2975 domain-containing protein [uncultured Ruminococcus sp.]|uniref:DUF2975 domain-containing protein n=1 Tax=uncultured Ruminococcus sp. TaxID=165186 RepID=UPI0025F10714|nr:DUF2975 domain-containing protein [uncultured Ruminococcus sp.]
MNKNISIIKRSSLVIAILSLLGAAMYVVAGISVERMSATLLRNYISAVGIGYFINAAALAVAALIFFRIFRSGRPFTRGNIWAVRGIAGFFIVKCLIQAVLEGKDLGIFKAVIAGGDSIFFAVLFLVIAEILRYGRLLQTESDETL